jgi:uncharacterized membrane protein YjgN (DUF898 family)
MTRRFAFMLVTVGIYTPWAMARIGGWFAEHTFLEAE